MTGLILATILLALSLGATFAEASKDKVSATSSLDLNNTSVNSTNTTNNSTNMTAPVKIPVKVAKKTSGCPCEHQS